MASIGDTYIGHITNLDSESVKTVSEVEVVDRESPVLYVEESPLESLTIDIALVIEDGKPPLEEQRDAVKALVKSNLKDNDFAYMDWYGYLSIESVDIPRDSDVQTVRFGTIDAKYFPWPEHFPDDEPTATTESDGFGVKFGENFGG